MIDKVITNMSIWLILASIILLFMLVFELGFQVGRHKHAKLNESGKSRVSTIEVAILSILGLLLAFTFVMAQTRFDFRQKLVIEEANAIGTTYLRANFLPEPQKFAIEKLLRQYVNLRLAAVKGNGENLHTVIIESERIHKQLWLQTLSVNMSKIRPEIFAVFISSLNKVISLHTDRVAAFTNRVPAFVLLVLLLCGVLAIGVTGYNCGLRNQRNFVPVSMLSILLVLVFFMIIDLDRPNHGLIKISQRSMIELKQNLCLNT